MLESMLNMKLRDFYGSLGDLADDAGLDEDALLEKLDRLNLRYDRERNRVVPK